LALLPAPAPAPAIVARFASHSLPEEIAGVGANSCRFENPFDRAFAAVASTEPRHGFGQRKKGFSQFNLLINFNLHHHPSGYAFHVVRSDPGDLAALRAQHARNGVLLYAADGATLRGRQFRASYHGDAEGGFLVPAANSVGSQPPPPLMRRLCCSLHPAYAVGSKGCQALLTTPVSKHRLVSFFSNTVILQHQPRPFVSHPFFCLYHPMQRLPIPFDKPNPFLLFFSLAPGGRAGHRRDVRLRGALWTPTAL